MSYEIGQIFEEKYPPEVALWCNNNNAYIEEIEPIDGHRRFQVVAIPAPTPEEQQQALMEQKKALRAEAVSKITVTVDGMEFDGDETAQDRMARAITMFQANNLPADYQTDWVLADNTIAKVTVTQLSQALLLAGKEQTALWTIPYQDEAKDAAE